MRQVSQGREVGGRFRKSVAELGDPAYTRTEQKPKRRNRFRLGA